MVRQVTTLAASCAVPWVMALGAAGRLAPTLSGRLALRTFSMFDGRWGWPSRLMRKPQMGRRIASRGHPRYPRIGGARGRADAGQTSGGCHVADREPFPPDF